VHAQLGEVLVDCRLVEGTGLDALDRDRILGAVAEAGPEAVAVDIAHQLRLAIDDLDRALGAGRHAVSAARAFLFVDPDQLSDGHLIDLPWSAPGAGG
jgi:hypothetical protein